MSDFGSNRDYGSPASSSLSSRQETEPPASVPIDQDQDAVNSPPRRRSTAPTSTREEFTLPCSPLQVKIPQDLIQSLKLHSINSGKTMSELVLDCLTSDQQIAKAWISTRRTA